MSNDGPCSNKALTSGVQCSVQAVKFRSFFTQPSRQPLLASLNVSNTCTNESHAATSLTAQLEEDPDVVLGNADADGICHGYLSDKSDNELEDCEWQNLEHDTPPENVEPPTLHPTSSTNVIPPPPQKQQRLDIPARDARNKAREARYQILKKGLLDIKKLIASKRTEFDAGQNGLQAYRA